VEIAAKTIPDQATLVPERREEVTTEGGLDLSSESAHIEAIVRKLQQQNVVVSAFIDPDEKQIALAQQQGFDAVELHTGEYANARGADQQATASALAGRWGTSSTARNATARWTRTQLPQCHCRCAPQRDARTEYRHAIVSRAVFVGLRQAVREMKDRIELALRGGDV